MCAWLLRPSLIMGVCDEFWWLILRHVTQLNSSVVLFYFPPLFLFSSLHSLFFLLYISPLSLLHFSFCPIWHQCSVLPPDSFYFLGGETNFPSLGIAVKPKKGRALLWPSTLDSDPSQIDARTMHEVQYVSMRRVPSSSFQNYYIAEVQTHHY